MKKKLILSGCILLLLLVIGCTRDMNTIEETTDEALIGETLSLFSKANLTCDVEKFESTLDDQITYVYNYWFAPQEYEENYTKEEFIDNRVDSRETIVGYDINNLVVSVDGDTATAHTTELQTLQEQDICQYEMKYNAIYSLVKKNDKWYINKI